MKINEIVGIHYHMDILSPEAYRAQRQAELEQMAKYRHMKLQIYKDWADPVKRAEIQAKHKAEEAESRTQLSSIPADQVAVRTGGKTFTAMKLVLLEPSRKLTRWQKIKAWFHGSAT